MAIGAIGGSLLGAAVQGIGAMGAARTQANAAAADRAYQERVTKPWTTTGGRAQNALAFEYGLGKAPAGYGGFQKTQDYTFGLNQGIDAVQSSAAARGGLYSGQVLKDLNQFGQDYGSQRRDTYLNRLAALSNTGLSATQNTAQAVGNANANQGNALSAGQVGFGNAINSGVTNAIGAWQYQKALQAGYAPMQPGASGYAIGG